MSDDLLKRLREVALEKRQEAWDRADGGQDLTIGAMLAEETADRIEALESALLAADELANAFESSGSVTDRHARACHALVAYRNRRATGGGT